MSTRKEVLVKVFKQKNVIALLAVLFVYLIFLAGCNELKHQDFYSTSPKYTLENTKDFERGRTMAKGSDSGPVVFFVPFGIKSPEVAMDDAIRRYPGNAVALENITIYPHTPFMFGVHGYYVRATAIIEP